MNFTIDFPSSPWGNSDLPGMNRLNWRAEVLLSRNKRRIAGMRVLDLACADGRMSFPCLELGALSVVGVEARQHRIDAGKILFSKLPYTGKMTFVQGDVFNFLEDAQPNTFDVILCFGFLYHTTRQVDFFRACRRLKPHTIIIDTAIAKNYWWFGRKKFGKPPALFFEQDDPGVERDSIDDDGFVCWPSASFLETMFERTDFQSERLLFRSAEIKNWSGMEDYKNGTAASYIATRRT
jgi:SAM-dependent methyltransferase